MKRWLALLCAVCLLFCVGCQRQAEPPEVEEKPIWEPEVPKTMDLTALLTREEVEKAFPNVTFGEGQLQEHDTLWLFSTEDYTTQVSLMVKEPAVTAAEYILVLAGQYPAGSLIEAPQLGESAYWCGDSGELLVAEGKYVISLSVQCTTLDAESRLIIARSLVLNVLERLEKKQ
ncbi:MAG: hypothetical protein E7552_00200 [Ruminococcaceae bacterium]|nr:hypothetical protein [Oscillospiraceae bacterium]